MTTQTTTNTTTYLLKPMTWIDPNTQIQRNIKIITQNSNGPCPLLALCNILILRGDIELRQSLESVSFEHLVELMGDFLLRNGSSLSPSKEENYFANLTSVLQLIPTLQTGLDVNVKFTGINDFELTPQLLLFDAFHVRLVHGWIPDSTNASETNVHQLLTTKYTSYNSAIEKSVSNDSSEINEQNESLLISQFLETYPTQLTPHGLSQLQSSLQPGELYAFFRNNHFSTLYKHVETGILYTLVTDQSLALDGGQNVVWETLTNVQGDEVFVNSGFSQNGNSGSNDSAVHGNEDYDLALRLQNEEDERERVAQHRELDRMERERQREQDTVRRQKKKEKKNSCCIQ